MKHFTQHQRDSSGIEDVGAFTRITIENDRGGTIKPRRSMQEWMYFESCEISDPDEGWQIVDQNVANVGTGGFASRHWNSLHPLGSQCRRGLVIKRYTEHAVGETLQW